jgi:hypothetical protein
MKMKSTLGAMAISGALIGVFTASPAVAATAAPNIPSACLAASYYSPDGGVAICSSGTGHFRVLIYCNDNPESGYGYFYYGPWVRARYGASSADCPGDEPNILSSGYDLANW